MTGYHNKQKPHLVARLDHRAKKTQELARIREENRDLRALIHRYEVAQASGSVEPETALTEIVSAKDKIRRNYRRYREIL